MVDQDIGTSLICRSFYPYGKVPPNRPNTTRQPSASFRILVVDDFEPWRWTVCSMLKGLAELQVVGEAADGLEAVQKTHTLKPDLSLLDVGIPKLNGIEAAKRLCQLVPSAKVLFVTQNNDADIVRAALSNGAQGYVLKVDAGSELLPAIKAVLYGEKFVTGGIKWQDCSGTEEGKSVSSL